MKFRHSLLIAAACLPLLAFSTQTLVYNKVTGSNHVTTTWTIDEKNNEYIIQGVNKNQVVDMRADIPYRLTHFEYQSKKNSDHYNIRLVNRKLEAKGEKKGEKISATHNIGSTPWIQDFEFGLKPFIKSKNKSINFVIVSPSNFKVHKMVARKKEMQTITVDGKERKTLYVKMTLAGFKKMFWKAQLWFDADSGDLIMYKANEGPHTPTTVITLASIDGKPEGWLKSMFKSDDDDDEDTSSQDAKAKSEPESKSSDTDAEESQSFEN